MGLALGCVGLSFDDFVRLDYDELASVLSCWHESEEARSRSQWERLRVEAAINIAPHVSKQIRPEQLLPLPWDAKRQPTARSTPERFTELVKGLGV